MVLIRGVPVERYGKDRASAVYWGVGTHLGHPWPQNAKGHLLGDVTDQGALDDPTARGNELGGIRCRSTRRLRPGRAVHPRRRGRRGDSLVANAVTIHNDLVRDDPDLAAELYEPYPYDLRGEQAPGSVLVHMPVFTRRRDRLFVRYIRPYIESSRRHPDAPARPSGPRPHSTGSTPCAPTPSTGWPWGCGRATCSS